MEEFAWAAQSGETVLVVNVRCTTDAYLMPPEEQLSVPNLIDVYKCLWCLHMWYNWCHSYWLMQNKYKLLSYEKNIYHIYHTVLHRMYMYLSCCHVYPLYTCMVIYWFIMFFKKMYYWLKVNTIFHKSLINTPLLFWN